MSKHQHHRKRAILLDETGPPCPRCQQPTQVFCHAEIGPKQRRQPYYFARWYNCDNPACRTNLIMPPEHRVWNSNAAAKAVQRKLAQRSAASRPEVKPGDVVWGESWDDVEAQSSDRPPWE